MLTARRTDWSDVFAYFERMGAADGVAIHHAATSSIPSVYDPAYLRAIERGEISMGYSALAYHRIPFASGEIAESRPNFAMGSATGGHNEHTFAYCVPGYMHPPYNHQVTDAQVRAIAVDIQELRTAGVLTADCIIRPHAWWTAGSQWATACCGETFIPRVAEIEALANSATPPGAPGETNGSSEMWACYWGNLDGTVTFIFGIGAMIALDVTGTPHAPYGVPMDQLNYVRYDGNGVTTKLVSPGVGWDLRKVSKRLVDA